MRISRRTLLNRLTEYDLRPRERYFDQKMLVLTASRDNWTGLVPKVVIYKCGKHCS